MNEKLQQAREIWAEERGEFDLILAGEGSMRGVIVEHERYSLHVASPWLRTDGEVAAYIRGMMAGMKALTLANEQAQTEEEAA